MTANKGKELRELWGQILEGLDEHWMDYKDNYQLTQKFQSLLAEASIEQEQPVAQPEAIQMELKRIAAAWRMCEIDVPVTIVERGYKKYGRWKQVHDAYGNHLFTAGRALDVEFIVLLLNALPAIDRAAKIVSPIAVPAVESIEQDAEIQRLGEALQEMRDEMIDMTRDLDMYKACARKLGAELDAIRVAATNDAVTLESSLKGLPPLPFMEGEKND